jgi:hypothetical protein
MIIQIPLNLIIYSDVSVEDALIKYKVFNKIHKGYLMNISDDYKKSLRKAFFKLRGVYLLLKLKKKSKTIINNSPSILELEMSDSTTRQLIKESEKKSLEKFLESRLLLENSPNDLFYNDALYHDLKYEQEDKIKYDIIILDNKRNYEICNNIDICYIQHTTNNNKKVTKTYYQDKIYLRYNRNYLIEGFSFEIISYDIDNILRIKKTSKFPTYLKIFLISLIFIIIWISLLILIKSIYESYGNNFIKICIMPLVSLLFVKLFIIANVLIFIQTILLWKYGKKYYSNPKRSFLLNIIFKALVPPKSNNQFKSIISFREFMENYNYQMIKTTKIKI